ncbi:hypothetical protein HPP92_022785 [Vanilla planifolia]|uniref:WW domain-containing protein n=1 Tax=Vanilla planifolia TaxID=51239 RepID=A0A835Q1A0_VANPL|nr:hypothetical protein HPP92_022785 [Vanilla planifolia]
MSAPNIEAVAAWLRNCSIDVEIKSTPSLHRAPPPAAKAEEEDMRPAVTEAEESEGVMVELNSELALPYQWEQCLDMITGELYYINCINGMRTTEDPRVAQSCVRESCYYSWVEHYTSGDADDEEEEDSGYDFEDSGSGTGVGSDKDDFYGKSSSRDSSAPASPSTPDACGEHTTAAGQILVAAGCKSCFMYFMVPKRVVACPRCSGCLLHLGPNSYE